MTTVKMKLPPSAGQAVYRLGADILASEGMQSEKQYRQHGTTSVFEHSVRVACLGVCIAALLHIKTNERSLVRGALLHDYFMYDWHIPDRGHRLHGFTHAARALENAVRDFDTDRIERNIIARHMFPLNLTPPRYIESIIVCIADKICAACETLFIDLSA